MRREITYSLSVEDDNDRELELMVTDEVMTLYAFLDTERVEKLHGILRAWLERRREPTGGGDRDLE